MVYSPLCGNRNGLADCAARALEAFDLQLSCGRCRTCFKVEVVRESCQNARENCRSRRAIAQMAINRRQRRSGGLHKRLRDRLALKEIH